MPDFKKYDENIEPFDDFDREDDNLVLDDYDSDDNDKKGNNSSDEDEDNLVTKVNKISMLNRKKKA